MIENIQLFHDPHFWIPFFFTFIFDGPPYIHQSNEKVKNGRKWGELYVQKVKINISRNYHPFQAVRKMTRIFGYIEGIISFIFGQSQNSKSQPIQDGRHFSSKVGLANPFWL